MFNRVLICGLPNSGKTTFAKFLIKQYQDNYTPYLWLNGDEVRKQNNDWDFSLNGRLRQTVRMCNLANGANDRDVIIDYVCPLEEYRYKISPNYLVYIKTEDYTPYENTKQLFEEPINANLIIYKKECIEEEANNLYKILISKK